MKQSLVESKREFNLKFLLVGASGSGKTHFCGTYTKGPVHFYMLDQGGEQTLHKLNKDRPKGAEITIDRFSMRQDKYSTFWKQLQKDEKEGFFSEMAERQGLVVLPDSLTAADEMALLEVAKKNKRSLTDVDKAMRIQDWGVLSSWLKELVNVINDLPCAVATPAHLQVQTDSEGAVIKRLPYITGKFANVIGSKFSEVYLLETRAKKHLLQFKERGGFEAKSRVFACSTLKEPTMDQLAEAYQKGDLLKDT